MTSIFSTNKAGKKVNPVFDTKWKEYKDTIDLMKKLQDQIKTHLDITKKYIASSAELSIQIAHFFNDSDEAVSRRTRAFGQLNAELERIQLTSVDKLYQQEVLQPLQVLWHYDKEIHKAVKDRKKMLNLEAKRLKQWQNKQAELKSLQEYEKKARATGQQKRGVFGKRKSITEVSKEMGEKERAYNATVEEQKVLTENIMKKFASLQKNKKTGDLLASSVSGIVSSQYHLTSETIKRLTKVRKNFTENQVFTKTLRMFDQAQLKGMVIQKDVQNSKGFVFGRRLITATPHIVCDCMAYIKKGLKTEGLFRIPGNRGIVERIRASYDNNENDILNTDEDIDIHDVCSTLKFYFNCMPEPLIPYATYEKLEKYFDSDAADNFEHNQVINIIQAISMPQKGLLGLVLNFLHDVSRKKEFNQMTSANLATCFAPVLLKPRPTPENKNIASLKNLKNIPANIATIELLIEKARLFGVPDPKQIAEHTNITEETIKRIEKVYAVSSQQHEANQEVLKTPGEVPVANPNLQPEPIANDHALLQSTLDQARTRQGSRAFSNNGTLNPRGGYAFNKTELTDFISVSQRTMGPKGRKKAIIKREAQSQIHESSIPTSQVEDINQEDVVQDTNEPTTTVSDPPAPPPKQMRVTSIRQEEEV